MNEYRMTRNSQYTNPKCAGHKDLSARDGHYIKATTPDDAVREMRTRYPDDQGFTIQLWKECNSLVN
jgi:hypothetical protein